ncbi:hypothetical protein BUE80_DR004184 [Diplocarpon rosae]|nr:hypothetical protein BUE80_DR004184 [Diplocarpon rosae]
MQFSVIFTLVIAAFASSSSAIRSPPVHNAAAIEHARQEHINSWSVLSIIIQNTAKSSNSD